MANPDHVARLRESVEDWNRWRAEWPVLRPDLYEAWLPHADLAQADLSRADLRRAVLNDAVLRGASLAKADLSEALFHKADFVGADLVGAKLDWAQGLGANFLEPVMDFGDRA